MLEIEKLERDWRKYKYKRFKPWLVTLFSLSILIGIFYFWNGNFDFSYYNDNATPNKNIIVEKKRFTAVEQRKITVPSENIELTVVSKDSIRTHEEKKSENNTSENESVSKKIRTSPKKDDVTVTLNPDTEFLDSFSELKDSKFNKRSDNFSREAVKHEDITAKSVMKRTASSESDKIIKKPPIENQREKTGLLVLSKKTNNTLDYLIKRFNEKRDPKLASYIAQSYYKKGNFKEAVRWSVMANSLDPSSEETWLVFARSKVKLGQKEDAIKALKVYLNQYNSRNIKSFLQSLEAGQ